MISVRAACHVHSNWSYDGKWPLERIAAAFSRRGYRVVMLTEHDRGFDEARRLKHREACRQASSERILLLSGIEYSDSRNCVHILTWGDIPFVGENLETELVLDAVAQAGGAAVFAHPSRKDAWKAFNPEWSKRLAGIECWNRKTDGWAPSNEAWPLLKNKGPVPFAGMDFHNSRQFFPFSTVIDVEEPICESTVLKALILKRCSSKAFGLCIEKFSNGLSARTMRCGEIFRRNVAMILRKIVGRDKIRLL